MIEPRTAGDGTKSYRVRVYHKSRYVTGRTFPRKADAVAWERLQKDSLNAGSWVSPAEASTTIAAWSTVWLASRNGKPTSEVRIAGLVRNHILPEFGRQPLFAIRPSEVQAWATKIAVRLSPSSARQALGVLRQMYKAAIRDGLATRNPTEGVRLPRTAANEPKPLTHRQLQKLANVLDERDKLLVLVAGYTGLRWGEVTALTRRDILVSRAEIRVSKAYSETNVLQLGTVKDHQARTVPVPQTVLQPLVSYSKKKKPDDLLFPSKTGTPLRNKNWRRDAFNPAVKAQGLDITPHNLRDTAASLAIGAGASVLAVARMLGHEDASVTMRHYAKLFPNDLNSVATALDREARKAMKNQN